MRARKLGDNQRAVLQSLVEFGRWHRGCGWLWDTNAGTERILDSLVRRGLARKDKDGYRPTLKTTMEVKNAKART